MHAEDGLAQIEHLRRTELQTSPATKMAVYTSGAVSFQECKLSPKGFKGRYPV